LAWRFSFVVLLRARVDAESIWLRGCLIGLY
jgi:hypothetical protein